jgi:leucyl aminopeptidase
MQTNLVQTAIQDIEADALILQHPVGHSAAAPLYASGEFAGKPLELALLHNPPGLKAKRLLLVGAGDVRKAAGAAVRFLKGKGCRTVAMAAEDVEASVEGAILGNYEPDHHKSEAEKRLQSFLVAGSGEEAFSRGVVLAESQNFARDLANEPSNLMNPTELANRAREMANEVGLEIEVLDEDRMRQLGMGSLLGVAIGSSQPPALIIIRYRPVQSTSPNVHLGLVGKGVTFDSGGISIKPAENMDKMKYDMCGAAGVLGAMRAIALLKPSIPVTGIVPAVENMINGRALRPGDILKTLNGKTVEVLNTDAEGRLILNDAITYAQRLGCTHLVDAATLTGSVVVALGHHYTGGYTNNQEFFAQVLAAATSQGERIWQLPLDEDYKEQLKSAFADLANIGTRWGGSITAAWFLKEFADPTPWVHLDIAGTAYHEEAKAWLAKGPTGICVRTFTALAARLGTEPSSPS